MLIKSLEQKTKLAFATVLASVIGCAVICCVTLWWSLSMVRQERNQIYILDGNIPFLAERAQLEANFVMEATAHIQLFHQYFFNLPPDDAFIKWTTGKALYLADESAMKQHQTMNEKGLYSDLVSSTATMSVICDSINFDEQSHKFVYYGTQTIKRKSRVLKRTLITSGNVVSDVRTRNNPHGLIITDWRIDENKDWVNGVKPS